VALNFNFKMCAYKDSTAYKCLNILIFFMNSYLKQITFLKAIFLNFTSLVDRTKESDSMLAADSWLR